MTTLLDQGRTGAWSTLRAKVLARDGHRCVNCGATEQLTVDHIIERQHFGTDAMDNLQTLCRTCHKAKTLAVKRAAGRGGASLVRAQDPAQLLPYVSERVGVATESADTAAPFTDSPRDPTESDGLPLRFTGPHPEATHSYGDLAAAWIEERMRSDPNPKVRSQGLRWFQWIALQRLLERRADGSWCWLVSLLSVGRQQGKSEALCELAAWRCANADLFGGLAQEVAHSASTVVVSRRVQMSRLQWAQAHDLGVARQLGSSHFKWPDGSVWETMAPENMYSRSHDLVLADEAWKWEADDFWQATFPTMAERPGAQAVMLSTAHDEPRTLVPGILADARDTLVMLWGAPPGSDTADPAVWRASSAFWTPHREAMMRAAQGRAAFASQWLNMWPSLGGNGSAWVDAQAWDAARDEGMAVPRRVQVAAVEEAPAGIGGTIALAWSDGGKVRVTAWETPDLADAWAQAGRADRVLCGASLAREPAARSARAVPVGTDELSPALTSVRTMLQERALAWDGAALGEQLRAAAVREGAGRLTVTGRTPTNMLRAAAWAASNVRTACEPVLL